MGEQVKTDSVFKHQQHLKIQKEDEETWISSEELRTEGSSDEEITAASSNFKGKKMKTRKKSLNNNKKEVQSASKETESPRTSTTVDPSLNIRWRPKRGSLTLPNLDEADAPDIDSMYSNMEMLERRVVENLELLESVKEDRLKMEVAFCKELQRNDGAMDRDTGEFFKLCHFEPNANTATAEEHLNLDPTILGVDCADNIAKVRIEKLPDRTEERKFIRKNIQLAAKAMSKLPLTDEEKQHLDHLLHEPSEDDTDANKTASGDGANVQTVLQNAFTIPEKDFKRINEIDSELDQNFPETSELRSEGEQKTEQENFWKSLVLEQALKEIDVKLAALHQAEEHVESNGEDHEQTTED